ncbi:MAG: hypothetical protein GXO34_01175 [Deltaproteobacteria bacterium]|nr:hypothetical protein [Deltaproteobacteria bacterium]
MDVFLLPARLVLGFYLLVDNLLPFLLSNSGGGVAHGAHIGGFLAGLLCAWGYYQLENRPDYEFGPVTTETGKHPPFTDPPLAHLKRALDNGERDVAFSALESLDLKELMSLEPDRITTLADWLRAAGHRRSADHLLRNYIKTHIGSPILAPVYLNLGRARIEEGQAPSAYQYLLEGLEHQPDPATEAALRQALAQVNSYWNKRKR